MSAESDTALLGALHTRVARDPAFVLRAEEAMRTGIDEALRDALERAADMESARSLVLAGRFRADREFMRQKLRKWNGRSTLNWDAYLTEVAK